MFITTINGTIFQLALPVIFIFYYRKKDILLTHIGYMWLAQNLAYTVFTKRVQETV